jgi:hypothetical protein
LRKKQEEVKKKREKVYGEKKKFKRREKKMTEAIESARVEKCIFGRMIYSRISG